MKRIIELVLIFLVLPIIGLAQQHSVQLSGYVYDADTKEALIGVTIQNLGDKSGTLTNNYGYYTITVPANEAVRIRISYIGFEPIEQTIKLEASKRQNFELTEAMESLNEVVVLGSHTTELRTLETGRIKLTGDDIRKAPTFMGENDLLKYVQLLPGIAQGSEGFSGPIVRGGGTDENLYLLDGNPLYNVTHLGGLFSTFNSDAIKSVNFYKGSFPARFGGRLSSVLDVRQKDGDMKEFHGTFSVGLLASKLHLEGPIWKDRTSFSISTRRTYLDLISKPFIAMANKKSREDGNGDESTPSYNFHDINAKVNHIFGDKDRVFLSFYLGNDILSVHDTYNYNQINYEKNQATRYQDISDVSMRWGNLLVSLGWNHIFSPKFFANTTLSYGQYLSKIVIEDEELYGSEASKMESMNKLNYRINSGIQDLGIRSDFEWRPNNQHFARFGIDAIAHRFRPMTMESKVTGDGVTEIDLNRLKKNLGSIITSKELALYAEDEIRLHDRFSANLGVRGSFLYVEGKQFWSLEPRVSANYAILPTLSLKASYAEMSQYVHLLQSTAVSLPTDLWVPVTSKLEPMRSRQAVLGLYWEEKGYEASLEGYYKWLHNQIAYQDGAKLSFSEVGWQDRVAQGEGRAYGTELMLRKTRGNLTGWIAYTLSWSDRIFPGGEVNNGIRFWDKYDNRHKVNIVANWRINRKVELSAAWIFSSGNHMTLETEKYFDISGRERPFISERNNYQLPPYHRLDLSANFYRFGKKGQEHIWNISIYNAYVHHNPFLIIEGENYVDNTEGKPINKRTYKSISIFPIIPSISYTYKF